MKGMVIQNMKKMFQRIGAMALSAMMAFSLMATPAMASTEQTTPNLKITGALDGVQYDVYPVLNLVNQTGDSYEYKLMSGTIGTAVKGVINEFLAANNDGYGFEIVGTDRVVFRVVTQDVPVENPGEGEPATRTETMDQAYERWEKSDAGKLFLSRFADAVKDAAEGDTDNLGDPVKSVKDNDANDLNTATGTIEIGLGKGYYLVISSAGQRAMISTQGNEGAEIKEKNKAPTLEKTVGEYANGQFKPKNDAAVGDTISFRVVIEARNGVNNLKFLDTLPEGLTFKELLCVRFVPLQEGAKKSDITFDKDGYPESMDKIRKVYTKSIPKGGTNLDEANKGVVNLWSTDPSQNNLVEVTLPDGKTNTSNIEIKFKSQWLNSWRSATEADMEVENATFDQPAMTSKDTTRMEHWKDSGSPDYKNAAMYNMYLGDVSIPEDDGGLILIDYKATLNENATVGGAGNANNAKLEYGNDPTTEEGKLTVVTPSTHTYTYKLDVHKYEKDNKSKPLAGAKFDLYRLENVVDGKRAGVTEIGTSANDLIVYTPKTTQSGASSGTTVTVPAKVEVKDSLILDKIEVGEPEGDDPKIYSMKVNDGKNQFTRIATGLTTDDDGRVKVERLDAGLYVLVETEAPDGYIKAEKPIYVVIGGVHTGSATVTNNTVDSNIYVQAGAGSRMFNLSDDKDSADVTAELVGVANASGLVMPTTGGIGTTVFYVVGGILIAGAGVLLVLKKREAGQQD